MLHRLLFCLMLVSLAGSLHSQPTNNFGFPSSFEYELNKVPFDPDANAVVLLHSASSSYDDERRLVTQHHFRIKILKEKGLEYANVNIPFYAEDNFEQIAYLEAMTINKKDNGEIEIAAVDRKSIFNEKTSRYLGNVKFSFPKATIGSILEYKYTSIMEHFGGLENWFFQREIPTIRSTYNLQVLPNVEFSYVAYVSPMLKVDVQNNTSTGEVFFSMNNIPGLKDEPYMDARKDYLQHIDFQLSAVGGSAYGKRKYMSTWAEVIKELLNNNSFGGQLNKRLSGTDDFVKMCASQDEYRKMQLAFEHVKMQMVWNGYDARYSESVKDAWTKKTGSSADMNLALVNLLQQLNLDAHPMLVSERSHGVVVTNQPFVDQFNKVVAFVNINGTNYYLDASDKYSTLALIPESILNTNALLIKKRDGGIMVVQDVKTAYQRTLASNVTIKDGKLEGEAYVSYLDYARHRNLQAYKANHKSFIESNFKTSLKNGDVHDFESVNELSDSLPYMQNFRFTDQLVENNGYYFINPTIFSGMSQNPFIEKTRFSNINFGARQSISSSIKIVVPNGYTIDALPKPIQIVNSDKTISFQRQIEKNSEGNELICRLRFQTGQGLYLSTEYPDVYAFYKKMSELLAEPIVLKKK